MIQCYLQKILLKPSLLNSKQILFLKLFIWIKLQYQQVVNDRGDGDGGDHDDDHVRSIHHDHDGDVKPHVHDYGDDDFKLHVHDGGHAI